MRGGYGVVEVVLQSVQVEVDDGDLAVELGIEDRCGFGCGVHGPGDCGGNVCLSNEVRLASSRRIEARVFLHDRRPIRISKVGNRLELGGVTNQVAIPFCQSKSALLPVAVPIAPPKPANPQPGPQGVRSCPCTDGVHH